MSAFDRKEIATSLISSGYRAVQVLRLLKVSRSSYYYQPSNGRKGLLPSTHTKTISGQLVPNSQVVFDIEMLLSQEFVDYGYLKVSHYLRTKKQYMVNKKKVYRLMSEHKLLNRSKKKIILGKVWVKDLVPVVCTPFSYYEWDIKYIYIQGARRNALLLTILDVFSRWVMVQSLSWQVKQEDAKDLLEQLFESYPTPDKIVIRNDNGSQFIAEKVREFLAEKQVVQEFTKPATPQQNAHIESYHSIIERTICQRYEFANLKVAKETFDRFKTFYNFERIHGGIKMDSPYEFLAKQGINMDKYAN